MNYGTCEKCLKGFYREPDQYWKRLCVECWKESKRHPHKQSYLGNRDTGIEDRLRRELDGWRLRAELAEGSLARHKCPSTVLDLATLKRIRLFVHPDKHDNCQAANEITQTINKLIGEFIT